MHIIIHHLNEYSHIAKLEELYGKYENMDFSEAEFLLELDGFIWMKFVGMNNDVEKWDDLVTYYQNVEVKIYEPIYGHFDIETAQAKAIFGFGGYGTNNQFVEIDDYGLLVSGSRSRNKVESAIDLYLKEIGEESMFELYQQPRLAYKDNGKVLWLSADGFDILFTRNFIY